MSAQHIFKSYSYEFITLKNICFDYRGYQLNRLTF